MSQSPFLVKKKTFKASDKGVLSDCLGYIEGELKSLKISKKLAIRAVLISEEMISEFIKHGSENSSITISVKHIIGDTRISITSEGTEFDPYSQLGMGLDLGKEDVTDEQSHEAIRSILLKSMGEKLRYSHRKGVNTAKIIVGQSEKSMLYATVIALVLGIIFGLLMKFVFPEGVSSGISAYVLEPAKTIFMNALKIIVGPVVFFSIVSCFSQFKDLSELGKIGAKVMATYLITTLIAVALGFTMALAFKPGEVGFALSLTGIEVAETAQVQTSVSSMITDIVPSNLLTPFLEGNTLQIIFLSALVGIAVGKVGEHARLLKDSIEALNSLFLTITSLITKFTPVAVFASIALLFADMDSEAITALMSYIRVFIFALFLMMCIYGLMVLVLGRLNPFRFYLNNREGMLTRFSLLSSSAAMPTNLRVCTDKMGVSPKVANFSIPLGATINMDGGCIFMAVSAIFIARAYAVDIPTSAFISLAITIILLSLSAPGIPGAGIINIGIVLTTIGVPIEGMALLLGIFPILDMFITMNNTTGDVAASVIVAKSEKLLDQDVFYGRKQRI